MRIPKSWVPILAKKIANNITSKELLRATIPMDKFIFNIEEIITEELTVEDRLNAEVRELLKKHESNIEHGRMDYRKLFELTKHRLLKERDIVI